VEYPEHINWKKAVCLMAMYFGHAVSDSVNLNDLKIFSHILAVQEDI
jgi:hypothetical protein